MQSYDISSSYCQCCGRLIDSQGNLIGIDGNNKYLLIDAFVGKNAEKIKKEKFSLCTFLFSYCYFAYRKMYLAAFLLFLFEQFFSLFLLSPLIGGILIPVFAIGRIVLAFKFNSLYMKHVTSKIKEIEMTNRVDFSTLFELSRNKGGVSSLAAFACGIFIVGNCLFILLLLAIASV